MGAAPVVGTRPHSIGLWLREVHRMVRYRSALIDIFSSKHLLLWTAYSIVLSAMVCAMVRVKYLLYKTLLPAVSLIIGVGLMLAIMMIQVSGRRELEKGRVSLFLAPFKFPMILDIIVEKV
ncbi:hypothetical protein K474DRAFT_1453849 [Panus rudis PR-1116 ss-1]|nr:hypothetical protein K474DRAFT_1453849 [Panus rudis PR-1116 ss-1]